MAKEGLRLKRSLFSSVVCLFLLAGLFFVSVDFAESVAGDGIVEVDVPPRGTFLHAIDGYPYHGGGNRVFDENLGLHVIVGSYYSVEDPAIVDLQSEGFLEGDKIIISYTVKIYYDGTYYPTNPDVAGWPVRNETNLFWGGLLGVFSSSPTLLDIESANRVPDAVPSGTSSFETPSTKWYEPMQEISDKLSSNGILWYSGPEFTDIPDDFLIAPYYGFEMTIPRNARFLFLCCIDDMYYDNLGEIKVTIEKDSDLDGLPDSWEINGIDIDKNGIIDLDLPMLGASWDHKDIFIEVDYDFDYSRISGFEPLVEQAFDNAPVWNPDGTNGINLHLLIDDPLWRDYETPHAFWSSIWGWGDFNQIKKDRFGTEAQRNSPNKDHIIAAKKLVYHYCIMSYTLYTNNGTHWNPDNACGGLGEYPGDDFMIFLGHSRKPADDIAGLFMHELGHNLNLHHGGGDKVNYKPNYLSVMNYFFDQTNLVPDRPLDYSRVKLDSLNETNLDENAGIGATHTRTLWWGPSPEYKLFISNVGQLRIDWNDDGNFTSGVRVNLNNGEDWGYNSPDNEVLEGFDDWENLVYRYRGFSGNFGASNHEGLTVEENYWEIVQRETEAAGSIQQGTVASESSWDQTGISEILNVFVQTLVDKPWIAGLGIAVTSILVIMVLVNRRKKPRINKDGN